MLSSSKLLSQEISQKQEITSRTESQIDETRNGYKPVSISIKKAECYGHTKPSYTGEWILPTLLRRGHYNPQSRKMKQTSASDSGFLPSKVT